MQAPVKVPSLFNCCRTLFLTLIMSLVAPGIYAGEPTHVFVSVLPQKFFVERIGGDSVRVDVMVKPGFSPHTYEPSPRQISALANADLYFRIGVPFELAWMKRIQGVNPDMMVVDNREGIDLLEMTDHDHDHHDHDDDHSKSAENTVRHAEHEDAGGANELDPHVWTSPQVAMVMATQIRDQLIDLLPAQESVFTANHVSLTEELRALDKELKALFSDSAERKFMVFHPSWGYFARDYGLIQVAIETEGKEPGARALSALIKQARKEQVKTIFVQPQFDDRAAKQVAGAIDGNVVAIDPLAGNYIENLRKAAKLIAGVANE